MTRLRAKNIRHITSTLSHYDLQLVKKTGATLRQIACRAIGIDEQEVCRTQSHFRVSIIPITSGQGMIKGFASAVKGIANHLGFPSSITRKTDVSGLGEAFEKGGNILLLADDHSFLAIHPVRRRVVDNAEATGKGFATALEMMTKGLREKEVLLIGAGRVGQSAAQSMAGMGAHLTVYDVDKDRSENLARRIRALLKVGVRVENDVEEALVRHRIYFDASPSPQFIHSKHITPDTYVAAPGVPLGLSPSARDKASDRLLHDPLQIGVATMILDAVYGNQEKVLP